MCPDERKLLTIMTNATNAIVITIGREKLYNERVRAMRMTSQPASEELQTKKNISLHSEQKDPAI